ncbi:MAG: glycosyltransferase family 2 protein, partial [bacterium]
MKLSVIILNYRTPDLTVKALESLTQAASGIEIERIVVDSASGDGSIEFIRERFPYVKIIALSENLGFAAGMNAGARAASGDYILFMNSDVVAFPGSLKILTDYLEANPDTGLVAPLLVDKNGNLTRTLLIQPTLLRILVPAIHKSILWRWQRRIGTEPLEVEAAEGAAPLVNRAAIEKAGLLDEDFFFYYEILEW